MVESRPAYLRVGETTISNHAPPLKYVEVTDLYLLNCGLVYIGRGSLASNILYGADNDYPDY